MEYQDKLHKNSQFLTTSLRVALFAAGLALLYHPETAQAAILPKFTHNMTGTALFQNRNAAAIEVGTGAVAETKPASVYGTTLVVDTDETEQARNNWVKEGDDWYYLLPDGTKNRQDLQFDQALYKFNWNGTLKSAQWVPNTGGGAYPVFYYDTETQLLFDQLNEEKKDLYFEEYPDREDEYSGDEKIQYDRYAGFLMDERLNQAAAYRLEAALANGYSGDAIPGEGTLKDYLAKISYRKNSNCRELYLRGREDADDAFDKLIGKTQDKYDSNGKRKNSLEYYRRIGMAHAEKDGEQYFMVILMR